MSIAHTTVAHTAGHPATVPSAAAAVPLIAAARTPRRHELEEELARWEKGERALVLASGTCAQDALLRSVLRPGDHLVLDVGAVAGLGRLLEEAYRPWGITWSAVDPCDLDAVRAAIRPEATAALWLGTPGGARLTVADLSAWASLAQGEGCLLFVDNTLATPAVQRPLEWGADAVVHSGLGLLAGRSDLVGGTVVVGDTEVQGHRLLDSLGAQHRLIGAALGAQERAALGEGLATLDLRLRRQGETALAVARSLEDHPGVREVFYPGLATHEGHRLAARQCAEGFGSVLSFRLSDAGAAVRFADATQSITPSPCLGGPTSRIWVEDGLVRLGVGLEDADALAGDLAHALDVVATEALGAPVLRERPAPLPRK